MTLLRGVLMAFSCFSKLPVPRLDWKDENMRYMLAALPLVGLVTGMLPAGWLCLCNWLGFSDTLFAGGVTLLPLMMTGGIHLDGFCDTVDARSSHAEPARKLEILKDPHPGAFAVVFVAAWLIGCFALASQLARSAETALLLPLMYAMSRIAGGYAALRFPLAGDGGMLSACRRAAAARPAAGLLIAAFVLCTAGMAAVALPAGICMAAVAALCAAYVRRMAIAEFGGMRGDLVGYLIAVSEVCMLATLILIQGVQAL